MEKINDFTLNSLMFIASLMLLIGLGIFQFPESVTSVEFGIKCFSLAGIAAIVIVSTKIHIAPFFKSVLIAGLWLSYEKLGRKSIKWTFLIGIFLIFSFFSMINWFYLWLITKLLFPDLNHFGRIAGMNTFWKTAISAWISTFFPFLFNYLDVQNNWTNQYQVFRGVVNRLNRMFMKEDWFFMRFVIKYIHKKTLVKYEHLS